jgi:hypothetical protein
MAKKFFYVCAGLMMLAAAYHLGASTASGQATQLQWSANVNQWTCAVAMGRTIHVAQAGAMGDVLPPVPGSAEIVALDATPNPAQAVVVLADGTCWSYGNGPSGGPSSWTPFVYGLSGATPVIRQSFGALKARYR